MGKSNNSWELIAYYLSPIKHLLELPGISEVCINKFDEIFIEQYGKIKQVDAVFESEHQVSTLIKCIANALGQVCSEYNNPILDARLEDGSRICGVLYPTATKGSNLTLRVFSKYKLTIQDLVNNKSLTSSIQDYLQKMIITKVNFLVSGGTGSGKTTMLNALLEYVPKNERVITVEDTQELQITANNLISLEAPTRNTNDKTINLSDLIKATLRMKPNRIIVGEIRDAEAAFAFLQAINTGHCSSATVHANHPADAITRMQTLISCTASMLPYDAIAEQLLSNLNVIIQTAQLSTGRRLVSIVEIHDNKIVPMFEWCMSEKKYITYNLEKSKILKLSSIFV